MIISVTDDATAILLTLTVRSVAPDTKIVVRIQEQTFQRQLGQAGADVIVSSTKIGGLLLADAVERAPYIVLFINDLLSTRGRRELAGAAWAAPHEIGCWSNAISGAVVVGLVRNGRMRSFYEDAPCTIQEGDVLMVISSSRQTRDVRT